MEMSIMVIQDAMKARITAANNAGELAYRLRSVATYDAEFDDLDKLAAVVRALPAVWVVLARAGKPERKGADKWLTPLTMAVMVGARSVQNHEAARLGSQTADGVAPGTYRMLDDMWDLFVGQDLADQGLRIKAFTPGETQTIFQTRVASQGISVLGLELHTEFLRAGRATREAAQAPALLQVGLNYHIKPGDDVADATDLVKFAAAQEDADA